jgi:phosphoribosyl 1,2-cyclic phosphodiesterase
MRYEILASGSKGNCTILEDRICIDAGVPFVKVKPYLDKIGLVLLTHEHGDHFKDSTVGRMAFERPSLRFGCGPFLKPFLVKAGVSERQIDVLNPKMTYSYGFCKVTPVSLVHDVPNYGYKVLFPHGKVFYATDTSSLAGIIAKSYDLYLVEANHDEEEIQARMDEKRQNGQYVYEQRVIHTHLSKQKCDEWLSWNKGENSECVYMHQHKE